MPETFLMVCILLYVKFNSKYMVEDCYSYKNVKVTFYRILSLQLLATSYTSMVLKGCPRPSVVSLHERKWMALLVCLMKWGGVV